MVLLLWNAFLVFTGGLCFCPGDITSSRVQESTPQVLSLFCSSRGAHTRLYCFGVVSPTVTLTPEYGAYLPALPHPSPNTTQRRRHGAWRGAPVNTARRPPTRSAFHEAVHRGAYGVQLPASAGSLRQNAAPQPAPLSGLRNTFPRGIIGGERERQGGDGVGETLR